MAKESRGPNRIHLIAHAGTIGNDIQRLRFSDLNEYLDFIRQHLPKPLRLTANRRVLGAEEDEWHGGRKDDAARIKDLQAALDDPQTLAIVSARGGAYFSRILPDLDLSALAKRRTPLWALGFSELTTLVNVVAGYRGGRGLYWLCPDFLAWKISPRSAGRAAFAEFWRNLPEIVANRTPADVRYLDFTPIRGRLVCGKLRSGGIRLVGGCIAVLAAAIASPELMRVRPTRRVPRWLAIEDINEPPYRLDRHLASLKIAGWLEHVGGILIGDFTAGRTDTQQAVVELLKHHLPRRDIPVVTSRSFGHTWPMTPLPVNENLSLTVRGRSVTITGKLHRE